MKSCVTTNNNFVYEGFGKICLSGRSKIDFPGLQDLLFEKTNRSGNQYNIPGIPEIINDGDFVSRQEFNTLCIMFKAMQDSISKNEGAILEIKDSIVKGVRDKSNDAIKIKDVAQILGNSVRRVDDLVKHGEIDSYTIGKSRNFRPSDVEAYRQRRVEENRQAVKKLTVLSSNEQNVEKIRNYLEWY